MFTSAVRHCLQYVVYTYTSYISGISVNNCAQSSRMGRRIHYAVRTAQINLELLYSITLIWF